MTIAEFAEEMRVRPVTVRSWISKGQLRATRGGRRKWLVRRSELSRMLEQGGGSTVVPKPPAAPSDERPDWDDYPPEVLEQMAKRAAEDAQAQLDQDDAESAYDWEIALEQSRMAPPDARFARRIRHIAQAAQRRAAVLRECIDDSSFVWRPEPGSRGLTLSYELRPGGNRPGPKDAWDRVDRVVARLGIALEGASASAAASAFSDLASAMNDVAGAIENRPRTSPEPDDGAGPVDDGATD
jgi:excisionase family DNA binding protein